MIKLPTSLLKLIDSFKKLPGVGSKTAERLSHFVIENSSSYSEDFAQNLLDINKEIIICDICFFLVEKNKDCICKNSIDKTIICVVQKPKDVIAFDRTGYKGMYHVIGGVLSPHKTPTKLSIYYHIAIGYIPKTKLLHIFLR